MLTHEPDWEDLPEVPASLRKLLRRCLAKRAEDRLHDVADARLELRDALDEPSAAAGVAAPTGPSAKQPVVVWAAAAAVAASLLTGLALWVLRPAPSAPPLVRSVLSARPSEPPLVTAIRNDVVITPDGRAVIYQAADSLYVRRIDQLEGTALAGTIGAGDPFLSPDGTWVGFLDGLTMKKVALQGGPSLTILEASGIPHSLRWEDDGNVYFGLFGDGLYRVPSGGGEPELLRELDAGAGESNLSWPQLLPGGRTLLLTIGHGPAFETGQIVALDLETKETKTLLSGGGRAIYVSTGHLLYAADRNLRAVAFDLAALEVLSDPVPVLEGVVTKIGPLMASFALSDDGALVYVSGSGSGGGLGSTLVWVDREGHEEELGAPVHSYEYPAISPDGDRIAVSIADAQRDVWTWDIRRQTLSPVTQESPWQFYSVSSRDNRQVIFASDAGGSQDLYRRAADGTGEIERLTKVPEGLIPSSLSPDEALLVYRIGFIAPFDLGVLELDTGTTRPLLVREDFNVLNGDISPDGRFLAYQTDESGRFEIYVRPFPDVEARRWPISNAGGTEPRWSPDGSEIFFRSDGRMMAAPVLQTEPEFEAGRPQELFSGDYREWFGRDYDVHPDGRFLMVRAAGQEEGGEPPRVILVQNWLEELKRLVPTD